MMYEPRRVGVTSVNRPLRKKRERKKRVVVYDLMKRPVITLRPCRWCCEPILIVRLPSGKTAPADLDGGSHFQSCPQFHEIRRKGITLP